MAPTSRRLALRTLPLDLAADDESLDWQYKPGLSALRDAERLTGGAA
jgi:hypothetical protein